MANFYMVEQTGRAILELLRKNYEREEGLPPGAQFCLYKASQFQDAIEFQNSPGFSLFIYRVGIDVIRSNMPIKSRPDGRHTRPGLPLILYFILTPWASTAEEQLTLLGWAMHTLNDAPILPSEVLNINNLEPKIFRPEDYAELVHDPLTLPDIAMVWESLQRPQIIPSATYQVRGLQIEDD